MDGVARTCTTRRWLVALLLLGLVTRIVAALISGGVVHPDEHQQYIEQSFRLLHGYGATFWEQDFGMRHPLTSAVLAAILWAGESVGLSDPAHLATFQRLVFCLLPYGAMSALAWSLHTRGREVAALTVAALLAACVDLTFIQVRVMSENLCVAFFATALTIGLKRPALAGALLGLMVAARLQSAPLAAGVWAIAAGAALRGEPDAKGRAVRLSAGLSVSLLAVGLSDRLYFGAWFHSFYASFHKQVVEDGASTWTTSPWYAYLTNGTGALLRASVFAVPLLVWGARLKPALAGVCALFVVAHSLIPHKEVRFLWPLIPLAALLVAAALEDLVRRDFFRRRAVVAALVLSFAVPSAVRCGLIRWNTEPYAASCEALAHVGRQGDVRGVALCGLPRHVAGNYFYLRRDVPIHYPADAAALAALADWRDGRINYLIVPRDQVPDPGSAHLEVVHVAERWVVCRRVPDGLARREVP